MDLSQEDRRVLTQVIAGLPEFANEKSRRDVIELVGLQELLPLLDLSGSPLLAASRLVGYLVNYGRLSFDRESLGVLLNGLKPFVGCEQEESFTALLSSFCMMTPIVSSPSVPLWHGTDTPDSLAEKIVGENTLRPICFLRAGLIAARAVAYIRVRSGSTTWSGTGFLVSPSLLMTNNHVITDEAQLENCLFRFNYEEDHEGKPKPPSHYGRKTNGVFHSNTALDYSLIELENEPGRHLGWIPLLPGSIAAGDRVNIIQHPQGQPKQISLQNNFVEYADTEVVQYVASTLPGSSGSPVLNDQWQLVAVHHAGGSIREPESKRVYFRNEGISIGRIISDIPPSVRSLIETQASSA